MKIEIVRGKTWEVSDLDSKTIALDGAVQGPHIDPVNEIYSFDHHANCIRLVTKATCQQVAEALILGLNPEGFNVLVNDVDGDTVLSVWLLKNKEAVHKPFVQELVLVVGSIDAHGPAFTLTEAQAKIAHKFYKGVMQAESKAHYVDCNYATVDLAELLDTCLAQLNLLVHSPDGYVTSDVPSEIDFEITHRADNFVMVNSQGPCFSECYKQGLNALIVYSALPDGSIAYTVGKKSEFVSGFDVPAVLAALNAVESGWGGGSTIGGAPRNEDGSRSHLSPDQVFEIVKRV